MSEFIREVDEDYRQDQIRRLLLRYRVPLIGVLVLVLVGVGGWRFYLYERQQRDEAAGARYFAATQLAAADRPGSISALDALAKDGPAGYRLLARFRAAGETAQGDAAAGVKAFDALAEDTGLDGEWRDVARLRAAMLVADSAAPADLHHRLDPLADANAPFRNVAREILAVAALKQGDEAQAKRWADMIVADPTAAPDQRQRAGLYLALVRAGKPTAATP
ncbi:MAG TPA: tetratricopeptide repeat protein [Lichenihabitans sp.]|nr:tetratricopeptide repeat protein [Lichenihabitans sp.]